MIRALREVFQRRVFVLPTVECDKQDSTSLRPRVGLDFRESPDCISDFRTGSEGQLPRAVVGHCAAGDSFFPTFSSEKTEVL